MLLKCPTKNIQPNIDNKIKPIRQKSNFVFLNFSKKKLFIPNYRNKNFLSGQFLYKKILNIHVG